MKKGFDEFCEFLMIASIVLVAGGVLLLIAAGLIIRG